MTQAWNRRQVLRAFGSAPLAAGLVWTQGEVLAAHRARILARQSGATFQPKFFTEHEYETVKVLVDLLIPRDERSGSATEAGVPEFMDFMMLDQPARQTGMRGGLAWLDVTCEKTFDRTFLRGSPEERASVLDQIAWPDRARRRMRHGAAFFSAFRDLTATGFWTSKMGFEDLQYMGNEFVPEWTGCPEEVLKKLGLQVPRVEP